ncbi:MAG: hypothetical protein KGJ64_09360 [Betaproteobacteria bacterium]|nr:hypothetical protein [Betaproteobacteria bacterium]
MKRWLLTLFALFVVAAAGPAHAGAVSFNFVNKTSLSFDYSLQLANGHKNQFLNVSTLGKATVQELTATPSIGPHQASHWQSYEVASSNDFDLIAFNMMTPDGRAYGLRWRVLKPDLHYCQVPAHASGVNMSIALEQDPQDGSLRLLEYTPDGDVCSFPVTAGFGPSVGAR